jgi:uncharacterized lipoprotein YddW (UPF0748 family)
MTRLLLRLTHTRLRWSRSLRAVLAFAVGITLTISSSGISAFAQAPLPSALTPASGVGFGAVGLADSSLENSLSEIAPPAPSVDPLGNLAPALGLPPLDIPTAADPETLAQLPRRPLPQIEDPSEQVAPPGLNIQPGDQPISQMLAINMRQELINLVGRFESALLSASSLDYTPELRTAQTDESLLAASGDAPAGTRPLSTSLHPVLAEARELIDEWTTLIEDQKFGEARDRWLATRNTLWREFPMDRPYAQPEIRAMWLDRGSIVRAGSIQGLARVFDRMAEAGINTVFVETVNAGYPIYPSRVAPAQNPLTRHWDPLAAAVELGQERNIEVHAWIWVFAVGNTPHNRLLNQPDDYPGPILSAHPDWAAYDNRGNILPPGQTKPFLDPANRQVRSFLMRMISEILTDYDVAGIHLDYIRYPFQDPSANRTFGYGTAARQEFRRMMGIDPAELSPRDNGSDSPEERQRQRYLWERWTDFRIHQVSSFVSEAAQLIRRQKPEAVVSVAVFPLAEHERLQKIQQDWNRWAEDNTVDWVVLMSYAMDTNRFEQLIRPWLRPNNANNTLILPGIRLLNLSDSATVDQIQALRDLPTSGYALFATDNLNPQLLSVFNRTQGIRNGDQPLPQAAPFRAAADRYQGLQREWSYLIDQQQLVISATNLERWASDVNEIGEALESLADRPSQRQLAQVRSRLATLQDGLGAGMDVRTPSGRYRLDAWRNRLATIDQILGYGERHKLSR